MTLQVVQEIVAAVKAGWGPDESYLRDRMEIRAGEDVLKGIACSPAKRAQSPPRANIATIAQPLAGNSVSGLPKDPAPVAETQDSPGPQSSGSLIKAVINSTRDRAHGEVHTLHALSIEEASVIEETLCGKILGRDLRQWVQSDFRWPNLCLLPYTRICGHKACRKVLDAPVESSDSSSSDSDSSESDSSGSGSSCSFSTPGSAI